MFVFLQSDKGFLYYPIPTRDSLVPLSHKIPSLFHSTRDSSLFPRISLLFQSDRIFLLFLSQRICLLDQSGKGLFYYSSLNKYALSFQSDRILHDPHHEKNIYYSNPANDFLWFLSHYMCFTIPVRQTILYYSSLTEFLYYSISTKDCLSFLFQNNSFIVPVRQGILY